jgi:hypothetical protein
VAAGILCGALFLVAGQPLALATPRSLAVAANEDPEGLIRQGIDLRRKGDDLRAEGYFKRAYSLAQTPRSAAQLGLVELALERHLEANQYLSEALDSDDAWIQKQRPVLEESRARARAHLARVDVEGAPHDAQVKVGSGASAKLSQDGKVWLPPGTTTVSVEGGGSPVLTKALTVKAGDTVKLIVPMAAAPSADKSILAQPPPAPTETNGVEPHLAPPDYGTPSEGRGLRVAGIATGIVGAAALAAGAVFYGRATTKRSAVASGMPYDDSDLDWPTYDHVGVGLMVGGGVAAAAGATLWFLGHRQAEGVHGGSGIALTIVPQASSVSIAGAF